MTPEKTNHTTELWQLTQDWLLLLGNKPNSKYCREEITTHPDYPAMTAVTDFLDAGNMRYQAVKADISYIDQLNYPLIAHIRQPGQEYMHIILNAAEWDKQNEVTQHWTGIAVYPEINSTWQNEQNDIYQKTAFKHSIFAGILSVMGVALLIATGVSQSSPLQAVFGLLSLLGLVTSLFVLGTELGYQSRIVKQVCGTVSDGGCEKVLKSNYAKGIFGITPADASVLYFGAQFIVFLLSPYFAGSLGFLFLFAFGGIAIAAWSIHIQAIKLKQWCALCISICVVLLLQALTAFLLTPNYHALGIEVSITSLVFLPLFVLLFILLQPIKGLIKTNKINQQKLAELKKWKTDTSLFMTLWEQEQVVDTSIWENDLVIGDPDATILITVGCNPYCGPCAKAHVQIDDMLRRFTGKLKIQLRLLCDSEKENDKRTIAVKAILQRAAVTADNAELQQMLSDWFEWMDIDKWSSKWKPDHDIDVTRSLSDHNTWMNKKTIQVTPTFFINGRKLPGRYSLEDLEFLIPQLAEVVSANSVK